MTCLCRYFSTELYVIYEIVLKKEKKQAKKQTNLKAVGSCLSSCVQLTESVCLHYSV